MSNQHTTTSSTQEEGYNGGTASSGKSHSTPIDPAPERDLESEAASHLLTKQEKSLCIQLDLKPTQYLTQKTLLLQVSDDRDRPRYCNLKHVSLHMSIFPLVSQEYLNGNRRSSIVPQSEPESRILHYLVTNGWIAAN